MPCDDLIGGDHLSMDAKALANVQSYRTAEAVEKLSSYRLHPVERYLFDRYYRPGDSVLDLACGAGRTTLRLHERDVRVVGLDISDVLVATAQRRFPYLDVRVGSYVTTGLAADSFDHVLISHNGIDYAHPVAERVRALRETWRVLHPGGTLIFSSHNIRSLLASPYHLIEVRRLAWWLRNWHNGFRSHAYIHDLEQHTFYGEPRYTIRQARDAGFELIEIVGFRLSRGLFPNTLMSPYIHYVFRKTT